MHILIYKRTHVGDPDHKGRFGIYNCMGTIRSYEYDAVIGVGGIGNELKSFGIDGKVNWVGIYPNKTPNPRLRGVQVTFQHFVLLEDQGPLLKELAPRLAKRLYKDGARILLSGYSDAEYAEAEEILKWSKKESTLKNTIGVPYEKIGCRSRCKPFEKSRMHC